MGIKIYKKIAVLATLLFSVWGVSFALNSVLTGIFPISSLFAENTSSLSLKSDQSKEQTADTLVQRENARILNPSDSVFQIREGFPYCETFTNSSTRANTIFGGTGNATGGGPWQPFLTSGVPVVGDPSGEGFLRLTQNQGNQNGFVYIDIPFPSKFGLKLSFEYFSYGSTEDVRADGFSFFMFDGALGQTTPNFEIGGVGGALGYAPLQTFSISNPGLKGAYLGIGFDELGNFGNIANGKYGAFYSAIDPPYSKGSAGNITGNNNRYYPHSVVIRGPVGGIEDVRIPFYDRDRYNDFIGSTTNRFKSYQFIDGKILNYSKNDPNPPIIAGNPIAPKVFEELEDRFFLNSKYDRFTIDANRITRPEDCYESGYRKVFIDLNPDENSLVNGRPTRFTIQVFMLVNISGVGPELIQVFDSPVSYEFPAPNLLKVGFAAATGNNVNFHDIRNVKVEVSDEVSLLPPLTKELKGEICEGAEQEFLLDVTLENDSGNDFIRCIQLYETEQDALYAEQNSRENSLFPANDSESPSLFCPFGTCQDFLCNPLNIFLRLPDEGIFEVFILSEVVAGIPKETPKVKFTGNPDFSGEVTVYYTVVDNFGKVSAPQPITITINPKPRPIITTSDPLVWEDFEINQIKVKFEANPKDSNYEYQWYQNGNPIPGAVNDFFIAAGSSAPGNYTVEIKTNEGCVGISQTAIEIILVRNLEPDIISFRENCFQEGSIRVLLEGPNVLGNEKWRILTSAGAIVVDWTFLTPGQSEIIQGGLLAGDYIFQLGDEFRSGQNGSNGLPLFRHVIPFTILSIQSPLQISGIIVSPELCFGEGGKVEFSASGGEGPTSYTFTLVNIATGQIISPTSINAGTAVFEGVLQGNYNAIVTSATRCTIQQPVTMTGPGTPLALALLASDGISCGINDSGFITWEASGGTPPFTLVNLSRNGVVVSNPLLTQTPNSNFAFTKLMVGQYVLTVSDANGCEISSPPVDLTALPNPVFEVNDLIICEGETAIVQPQIIELSNSQPIFTWTNHQGNVLTGNTTIAGITYTFQDDGNPQTPLELQISGLAPGTYEFILSISGTNICTQPDQRVEIIVSPVPVIEKVETSNLTCYQSGDGTLEVIMATGLDPADYTYELLGYTGAQASNVFGNLQAGTYQIRVVDKVSNCDTVVADLEITEPQILEIVDLVQNNPSCDLNNGSFSFTVQGGTPAYTLLINNTPIADFGPTKTGENYLIENLAPGSYVIQVTDASACVFNSPPLILVNDPLDPVTVDPMDIQICVGNTATIIPKIATAGSFQIRWFKDASATQEISSGQIDPDGVSYQITAGTGTLSITGLQVNPAYRYFMEVSGPQLCTIIELAEVEVLTGITASIDVSPITCFGDTDGALTINPSGGNGFFEVSINGSPFTQSLSYLNLAPGDYTIDIRNDISCTYTTTVRVESPTGPIAINQPTIERSSCDLDNGSIRDLVISGGWGGYQVEWRKGTVNGPLVAGTLTQALDLAPDTYYLTVTDLQGCEAIFDFLIEESSDPVYLLVPPINTCTGDPVRIRPVHLAPDPSLPPAAATEVRWYTGPGQTGLIQNGSDPSRPGVKYTIDDTDWLNPELVIEGLPAGDHSYYFYVVCTGAELKVEISVFETPTVQLVTGPIVCFGDSNGKIRISNELPVYTFSLNSGAPTSKAAIEALNLPVGNYTLIVNTPAGTCAQTLDFEIKGPQAPLAVSPLTKIDPGCGAPNGKLELTITGGWLPYTLEVFKDGLSQGSQNTTLSKITLDGYRPGTYYIVVRDKEGCTVTTNTITMVDGPTQILVDKVESCFGETVVLSPFLDPVAPGAVFQWFFDAAKTLPINSSPVPGPNGVIYQINPANGQLTISGLSAAASDYNYYVTASGAGVCPGFTGIGAVKVHEIPTATLQIANEVCFGDGGTILVNAGGGSGIYSYSLNGGAFVNFNSFKVPTGIHTLEVRTAEGCSVTIDNIVVVGPSAALVVENLNLDNPSCDTDNGVVRFEIKGGYEPYSIAVIQNGNLIRTQTLNASGLLTISNLRKGIYNFEITDDQGCVYKVPGSLDLVEVPSNISAADDVICEGETVLLTPTLPSNIANPAYTWSFDAAGNNQISNGVVNNVIYNIAPNGQLTIEGLPAVNSPYTYYIMATGPGICGISPKPVQVTVHAIPNLRVSNPSIVCDPLGTVDLTDYIEGFNPAVFDYNVVSPGGVAMRLDEIDEVDFSGDYRVSSSLKGTGCWNPNQRIRVIIADKEIVANFEYKFDLGDGVLVPNTIVQIQEDVFFEDLSVGNVLIWNWDFGDGNTSGVQNPIHQFQEKGTYTVTLTAIDTIGCVSIFQTVITVNADYTIMIPNAFTPDGLKNQYFKPYYRGISSMEFYIFNTWGELIYKAESLEDRGWNGFHNGDPAINGNYVYRGVFMTRGGEKIEKSGVFILIR